MCRDIKVTFNYCRRKIEREKREWGERDHVIVRVLAVTEPSPKSIPLLLELSLSVRKFGEVQTHFLPFFLSFTFVKLLLASLENLKYSNK